MMNVASLENCRTLYELSGWQAVEQYWEYYPVTKDARLKKSAPGNAFPNDKMLPDLITPAYDLGYLLRKLPEPFRLSKNHNRYEAGLLYRGNRLFPYREAQTPEDAACKLAIELFKQGVLTKQHEPKQRRGK